MNNHKKHFYIMRCLSIILAICIAITSIQLPVYADNAGSESNRYYFDDDISASGDGEEIFPENSDSPIAVGDDEISAGDVEFPDNAFSNAIIQDGDIGTGETEEIISSIDPESEEDINAGWPDVNDMVMDSASISNTAKASKSEDLVGSDAEPAAEIIDESIDESVDESIAESVDEGIVEPVDEIIDDFEEIEAPDINDRGTEETGEEIVGASDVLGMSELTVEVGVGKSKNLTATCSGVNYPVYLQAYMINTDLVSTKWGSWRDNGTKVDLTITGKKAGRTYIYVYMRRSSDNAILKTVRVYVVINGNPTIKASESSVSMTHGSAKRITMSYGGTNSVVKMSVKASNDVVKLQWGNWSGNTVPLTISGVKPGSSQLTVSLLNGSTNAVLASTTVYVYVRSMARIVASNSNLTINVGNSGYVTLTVSNYYETCSLKYGITNTSVASCSWEKPNQSSAKLKITGKKAGQTKVYVYLYDASRQNVLTQTSFTVNVLDRPQVVASASNLSLKVDESKKVSFTIKNMSGVSRLRYSVNSDRYVNCVWDRYWTNNGTTVGMTITGKNAGNVKITVYLLTADDKQVASTVVNVSVNPADKTRMVLSTGSMTIKQGQTGMLTVWYYSLSVPAYIEYSINNTSVVSCKWGANSGNSISLSVSGKAKGGTYVNLYIKRSSNNSVLASASFYVTVQESDSTLANLSYSYENFGEAASERLCQYMFRDNQSAYAAYRAMVGNGGNCFGFASTSGMFYVPGNNVYVSTFGSGRSRIRDLKENDRNSAWGLTSKEFNMAMQTAQLASQFNGKLHFVSESGLSDLVATVNREFGFYNRPVLIGIRGNSYEGYDSGHALLAYKVDKLSSTEEHLMVYDCNDSLKARYITLKKNASGKYTSWSYDMGVHGIWGTGHPNARISYTYYSDYMMLWNERGKLIERHSNLIVANTDDFTLKDVNDHVVATVKDGVLNSLDESIFMVQPLQIRKTPQTILYVPVRLYTFQNDDIGLDELEVGISNVDLGTWVKTTADEIYLCADDDYSLMSAMILDAEGENYDITLRSSREGDSEAINLSGVGDDDMISAMVDNGSLSVCNTENADLSVGEVNEDKTDISSCSIEPIPDTSYSGKAIEPSIKIKDGKKDLTAQVDYELYYNDNLNVGTASVTVVGIGKYKGETELYYTIAKASAGLKFAESSVVKTIGDAAFKNKLTKKTDSTVRYTSSNTDVATVNKTSGLITIKGTGTTKITAKTAEMQNFNSGEISFTLTVNDGASVSKTFSDVQDPNHAFYNAIYWAADAGITKGYPDGTFGIDRSCTRGEMIMFLWRYAGKPSPKAVSNSPFADVPKTHAFYNAILWASQKGITKGYPDGTFGINRNVSRGECMMFLWRLKGKPAPKAVSVTPFKDVPKNHAFYNAILWGYQKKITTGYTSGAKKGTFGINENCTRGAIVTFLYRAR